MYCKSILFSKLFLEREIQNVNPLKHTKEYQEPPKSERKELKEETAIGGVGKRLFGSYVQTYFLVMISTIRI